MNEKVQHLVQTVEDLLKEYQGLVEDGQRQREALVAGDMEALDRIVRGMDERMKRIAAHERRRLAIGEALAEEWGIRPDELRLSTVAERVGPATRRRMEEIAGEFDRVLTELERVNDQNRALTEQSLTYVRQMIDVITAAQDTGVYGPPDGARPYGPDAAGGPAGASFHGPQPEGGLAGTAYGPQSAGAPAVPSGTGPARGAAGAPVPPRSGMPAAGARLFDTRA
ncbi:flagellar protein FlgN [Kyrpidia tusciae]|uniref:FlgN family protein n=1 Tax=Kyrpidia tusciae (strain DSM 2912 / NBRC 15312 / T2) TaxID=562970 RepID=D5WVS3_KYRT2|nr:flagellar protein FlgN [Kyrpidia tusciae]ADG07616.1 FlgN family protein [Kyrpidia tusciae DSM 2912]